MRRRGRRRLRRRWIILLSVLIVIILILLLSRSCSGEKVGSGGKAESGGSAVQENSSKTGDSGEIALESSTSAAADQTAGKNGTVQSGSQKDDGDPETVTDQASGQSETSAPSKTELEKGKEYLESLDKRKPDEVKEKIDVEKAAYEAKKEERAYALKRKEYLDTLEGDALWSSFDDFVFLGDSRVVGFSLYGYLPSDRVLAETGDTIRAIEGNMDSIRSLQPGKIFISYGINDISCGLWSTADEYAEDFARQLDDLKKELPDADIYVNSILPATEEAVGNAPVWGGLPEFSEAVRKVCEKKKVSFIDNQNLIKEHADLYEGDGVHVKPDFYRFWAENQILAVFDRTNGRLTFSSDY